MELIQQRIQTTALTKKNQELNQKMVIMNEEMQKIEDEKSKLNRKIQKCLRTAQVYEQKYYEQESKVSKLTNDLYKKTKQCNTTKKEIEKLVRQQAVNEHCEHIKIGNINAVQAMDTRLEESMSTEQQAEHYKRVYAWMQE